MEKKAEKLIKESKRDIKKYYLDLLIGDGFDVNKKSSMDDVYAVASDIDRDEYEGVAWNVGYIEGLREAINLNKHNL